MKLGIKLQFNYTGTEKEAYQSSLRVFSGDKEVSKDIERVYFGHIFDGIKVNNICEIYT